MTVNTFDPGAAEVTMTEAAIVHFQKALNGKADKIVRLSTEVTGCSGFGYVLDLVDGAEEGDIVLQPGEDITLAVAADAMTILHGTEIDMVTEGVNRVVKFNNPNVTAECGCGESFTVG